MNYSREWQKHLDYYNSLARKYDWDYVARKKELTDPKNGKAENLVVLNKPVWVEIHDTGGDKPFRKIKAISRYNAYFDGTYAGLPPFPLPRSPARMGLYYRRPYEQDDNQERLLDFIKEYSDGFCRPVPKGIPKIPAFI